MFFSHISFALGLIALVMGVSLYLWSVRAEMGAGVTFAKVISIIVIVLSILEVVCTVYTAVRTKEFMNFMMTRSHCPGADCSKMKNQNNLTQDSEMPANTAPNNAQ